MAKFLVLDKKLYDPSKGLIPLRRGDDWALNGQVVEKFAGYCQPVDLTAAAATGFFEGASGGDVTATVTFNNAAGGAVTLSLTELQSAQVALNDEGRAYMTVLIGGSLETIEMPSADLEVRDRGYSAI